MSLSIMIGSEPEDYVNIKNTIHFLDAIKELHPIGVVDDERKEVLENLIGWYQSMYDVLTNPSLAPQEMFNPAELTN